VTLEGRTIALDCRWLGIGGAGRVTELLLAELAEAPPPGAWTLWGRPERIGRFVFPGASVQPFASDPRAGWGQRALRAVPACDVVLYAHQTRPIRPGRSVTVIHDTIPVRFGGAAPQRALKRAFLRAVARVSTRILTDSEASRDAILRDLRVAPDRVAVMRFPTDLERARRVAELRETLPQEPVLLYVGTFMAHKNLPRLTRAFAQSAFAAAGGRLLLVGGGDATAGLRARLDADGIAGVEVREACDDDELDRLLATSRALVQPSLEEGYGLPPFEAAASGLPVAVTPAGALLDLPEEVRVVFDPRDVAGMTRAIDEATRRPAGPPRAVSESNLRATVLASLEQALA
jgi:glycosyltransferase involved in cell wall biosynthesis